MTDYQLKPTMDALAPIWRLPPPGPKDLYRHPAFNAFKAYCEQHFPAADRGMGFSFGLVDALRSAGLPCLMSGSASAATLEEGAANIAAAFAATSARFYSTRAPPDGA